MADNSHVLETENSEPIPGTRGIRLTSDTSDRSRSQPTLRAATPWRATVRYLSQTEVHVYALSIAASVLLSFFPFLIVMLTLVRDVFHLPTAERALFLALRDYFPGELGAFIRHNLTKLHHGRFQITSLVLLLFTANGVFEPLEVALNRAWGVPKNRTYLKNQLLSLFLILLCGGLALGSILLTAVNQNFVANQFGIEVFPAWLSSAIYQTAAVPVTILALFLTYRILPNCHIPARRIVPVAVIVGIGLEVLKYLFLFAWPWINRKFENEYGPFRYSVSIVVVSVMASMLVLAGADWSARKSEIKLEDAGSGEAAGLKEH